MSTSILTSRAVSSLDYSLLALCVLDALLSTDIRSRAYFFALDRPMSKALATAPGLPENGEAEEGETLIYDASQAD